MNSHSNLLKTAVLLAAALWAGSANRGALPTPVNFTGTTVAPLVADETEPFELAPNLRRQLSPIRPMSRPAPSSSIPRTPTSITCSATAGDPLRHRRWPPRLHLVRRRARHAQGRVAGLVPACGDDRAPALSRPLHCRARRQPARRPRHLSRNTVYRIHGTNAPATIGTNVSSGCIRLLNADVVDLYSRINVGTKVIVLPNHGAVATIAAPAPQANTIRSAGIYEPYLVDNLTKEFLMRSILKAGMLVAMLAVLPVAAQAGTLEGVAIGAGTGAVVADLSRCRRRRHRRRGRRSGHRGPPPSSSPLLDRPQWLPSLRLALNVRLTLACRDPERPFAAPAPHREEANSVAHEIILSSRNPKG